MHGNVQLTPALPADGKYPAGTVVTVTTTPDSGYALDSVWYSVPGASARRTTRSTTREFKVTIDQDKRIGASFVEEPRVKDLTVTNDVVFAKPGVKPLKYDVYAPKGARNLPVIVIIHGGGWNANDEDVMRGLGRELTKGGKFVAASMDYRWSAKSDGDTTGNTMADLIEDVFGGIAHIVEHARAVRRRSDAHRRHRRQRRRASRGRGVADDEQDRLARLRQDTGRVRVPAELPAEGQDRRAGEGRPDQGDQGRGAELRRVQHGAAEHLLGESGGR